MLGICQTILRFDSKTLEYISQVLGEEVFNNPPPIIHSRLPPAYLILAESPFHLLLKRLIELDVS